MWPAVTTQHDDAIRAFWTWWATGREQVQRAIEVDHEFSEQLIDDISRHVDAIGDLDWELAPGAVANHAFCLSPKGDPEARIITELWRQRGPDADATWEYHPARQAREGMLLGIGGVELDAEDLLVELAVDEGTERIDGTYFHPRFSELEEALPRTALFLLLDGALGEDGVERWLGGIELATTAPPAAVSLQRLREAVASLEETADGQKFMILQHMTDAGPAFATINRALKRIDHVLFTTHASLDLAILDRNAEGLTTQADAEMLDQLEDELSAALGVHVAYLGRETRPGHRVLHWYAPDDSPVRSIIERWAADHPARTPELEVSYDPTWEFARRFA